MIEKKEDDLVDDLVDDLEIYLTQPKNDNENNNILIRDSIMHIQYENIYLKYYWKILIIIACFYILPSFQFMLFQANDNTIYCYFNHKCKHNWGYIPAFNNFISNLGYIIFGILFIIYTIIDKKDENGRGIHKDNSIYICLGLSLLLEGIFSSLYHLCPSKINFQFDSTFMFIGIIFAYIAIYSKRNLQKLPSPIKLYSSISFIIILNILSLSGIITGKDIWFWIFLLCILECGMLKCTYYIYYNKSLEFKKIYLLELINDFRNLKLENIPTLIFTIISNISTIIVGFIGIFYQSSFTDWMMAIITLNLLIYYIYYILQKIYNKESISILWIIILVMTILILSLSIFIFNIPVSNKLLTPNESNKLNKPCILFNYFDYHDLWHFISSFGLFLLILNIYLIDKKLDYLQRNEIKIF